MKTSVIAYYKGDISDAFKDDPHKHYNHYIYKKIIKNYIDKKNGYIRSSVKKDKVNIVKFILSSYDDFIKDAEICPCKSRYIEIIFKKKSVKLLLT